MNWVQRLLKKLLREKVSEDDAPAWLKEATVRLLTQLEDLAQNATALRDRGDLDGALALYREQARLCREEPTNMEGLAYSLANQATLLAFDKKRPKDGLPLAEEALRLAREYGMLMHTETLNALEDVVRDIRDAMNG